MSFQGSAGGQASRTLEIPRPTWKGAPLDGQNCHPKKNPLTHGGGATAAGDATASDACWTRCAHPGEVLLGDPNVGSTLGTTPEVSSGYTRCVSQILIILLSHQNIVDNPRLFYSFSFQELLWSVMSWTNSRTESTVCVSMARWHAELALQENSAVEVLFQGGAEISQVFKDRNER